MKANTDAKVLKAKLALNWTGPYKVLAVGPCSSVQTPDGSPLGDNLLYLDLSSVLPTTAFVKALVRWATGKRLTNCLPKLSLITLSPPSEQRDSWSSYGAVRAYSEVLYNLWGPRESDLPDS